MIDKPAFPTARVTINGVDEQDGIQTFSGGMTLRQYAAIKLKMPKSGNEELDDMIRASLRNDFAAKAMQGLLSDGVGESANINIIASDACIAADAMLRAREEK
jgi:hypothetical protein